MDVFLDKERNENQSKEIVEGGEEKDELEMLNDGMEYCKS